jgi:hypothetical protein
MRIFEENYPMADKNKEQEPDGKKYFDPTQYNTLLVDMNGKTELNSDKVDNLVSLLTDPSNKEQRREVLNALRENQKQAVPMLIEAIKSDTSSENRHLVIAACWEAELNFSNYLKFFTEVTVTEDYLSAIEAMTVIENMAGPFKKNEVQESTRIIEAFLSKGNSEKATLLKELLIILQSLPI